MNFADAGKAMAPVVCSVCQCVAATYTSVCLLTLATSRSTRSPFTRPAPGSITSVARLPTTIPTLGTTGVLSSGIAYVCGPTFTVPFSLTSGSGPGACCAKRPAAARHTRNSGSRLNNRHFMERLPFSVDSQQLLQIAAEDGFLVGVAE